MFYEVSFYIVSVAFGAWLLGTIILGRRNER